MEANPASSGEMRNYATVKVGGSWEERPNEAWQGWSEDVVK